MKVKDLARVLYYILGHRPDEFGLVPDADGAVSYKELLQAFHEEPGWRYVRKIHIKEVLLEEGRNLFHSEGDRIKALERHWHRDLDMPSPTPPRILFAPVRQRAHPVALEKGLNPNKGSHVVLTGDRIMASRLGKRRDHKPVLLEILAASAQGKGVQFYPFGELFLSPMIPPEFISGPPVSKELMEKRREMEAKKKEAKSDPIDLSPGTFSLDMMNDPDLRRREKGKKRKGWKEQSRKIRKNKR